MFGKLNEKRAAAAAAAAAATPTFGVLIVGIGGNNGVTMLAGIRANQLVRTYAQCMASSRGGRA